MDNSEYKALTQQAVKGDKQSLKDLFSFGEKLMEDGVFEEAASASPSS